MAKLRIFNNLADCASGAAQGTRDSSTWLITSTQLWTA